jgi:hypothetical protein
MTTPNSNPFSPKLNSILEDIFGGNLWNRRSSKPRSDKPKAPEVTIAYNHYDTDYIQQILALYVQGVAIDDISAVVQQSADAVNDVLDRYLPSLESYDF